MRPQSRVNWILFGICLSLVLPAMGSVVSAAFFPDARFSHLPIHSLIEAMGGLMAIAIAGILIVERPRKDNSDHYPWMASALVGMGVLDLFHAGVLPGANFVWLHSTATFIGGLIFAFVWLGLRGLSDRLANRLPWILLAVTTVFGIVSCIFSAWIPTMAVDGQFTFLARGLNIGGGLGFLLAGAFFVSRFHRRYEHEDWLFAVHTILFGAAGILFELSALWDAAWWWWHILRMIAYLAALAFAIRAYLDAELELVTMNRQLNDLNRNLDQTVEKRTSELSHERFLLQTLLEHLPDAIHFKDQAGKYTRASHSLADRLGCTLQEVIGKSDENLFPAEYAAQTRAEELELMQSGIPLIGKQENWPLDRDSWFSTTKLPLPDPEGRTVGTFGLSHDVTIQKTAEVNFRSVIDAAPNPLLVVNAEGMIELTNAATGQVFGYEPEELIGRSIEALVPERDREQHEMQRRQYMQNPRTRAIGVDRELSGRRRDGSEFPAEIGLNPVQLNGETAVLANVLDITARKQVQDALIAAKQAAEKANQAKSDFLANMSHEIRTPMNAIIGMTELLLDEELKPTQRDYLDTVLDSAEALLGIINEILDFSKIEAGQLELEELELDLRGELAEMLRTLSNRAFVKGLELTLQVDSDVPERVLGDPIRIRQILLNLVGNSIKFTEQGEIVVAVSCPERTDREALLGVEVRDTGVGIRKDKLESIFSAFAQADTSTTRRFGGTGLGLTISSRLAEAMGGKIQVESQLGHGSTFRFTMRLGLAQDTQVEPINLSDLNSQPALVVDDNATNRKVLNEMLQRWGMRVHAVESGREAVSYLEQIAKEQGTLPLILSDVNMPEMDGFMLAEQVRKNAELRSAVIILLTSGGQVGDAKRRQELKISKQLMKPVKQSELLEAILVAVRQPETSERTPEKPATEKTPQLKSLRILLAEDGKTNQMLAVNLLEKWGHAVTVADDGLVALQLWETQSFDVILMDVQMPVMDGFESTRQIRLKEDQRDTRIPIVAMTAHAMKGDRERCLESGMDGYVAKPIRRKELYTALAEFFGNDESEPSSESRDTSTSDSSTDAF